MDDNIKKICGINWMRFASSFSLCAISGDPDVSDQFTVIILGNNNGSGFPSPSSVIDEGLLMMIEKVDSFRSRCRKIEYGNDDFCDLFRFH